MNWHPDDYLAAWYFAPRAHAGQTFKGQRPDEHLPYCVHLGVVAMEVTHALKSRPDLDGRLALQVALLHDVIEDTSTLLSASGRGVWGASGARCVGAEQK